MKKSVVHNLLLISSMKQPLWRSILLKSAFSEDGLGLRGEKVINHISHEWSNHNDVKLKFCQKNETWSLRFTNTVLSYLKLTSLNNFITQERKTDLLIIRSLVFNWRTKQDVVNLCSPEHEPSVLYRRNLVWKYFMSRSESLWISRNK